MIGLQWWEPYELRGSRMVLREAGVKLPGLLTVSEGKLIKFLFVFPLNSLFFYVIYKFNVIRKNRKSSGNKELILNWLEAGIKFSFSQACAQAVAYSFQQPD